MPETVWFPGGLEIEIHVATDAFTLVVDRPRAGSVVPRHAHRVESETILLTAGAYVLDVDGAESALRPGDSVHVPAGTPHAGSALEDCTRVIVFSPGGMEAFFRTAGSADPMREPDPRALLAAARDAGWDFAV